MAVQIQIRHDTAANWTAANPILAVGEMGIETNTRKIKIGDGVTNWNTLLYFEQQVGPQGAPGEGVPVGGTTGQALIKNSNLDYDTIWSNDPYARANHTGTQTASTISDFNSTVTSTITTTVNKTFVDNLNVDADTLDGIDSLGFATAAQGTLATTAVQPGDFTNTLAQIDAATDKVQVATGDLLHTGNTPIQPNATNLIVNGRLGVDTTLSPSFNAVVGVPGSTVDTTLQIASSTSTTGNLFFGDTTGTGSGAFSGYVQYSHADDSMRFGVLGERLRIDASGNVTMPAGGKLGIGTTTPDAPVEIKDTTSGASTAKVLTLRGGTAGSAGAGARVTLTSSNLDPLSRGAYVEAIATDTSSGHALAFGTNAAAATPTEHLRLDSSGNLLVGTTSLPDAAIPGTAIRPGSIYNSRATTSSTQHIRFFNPNGQVGSIQTAASSTTYVTTSDQRLKENITDAASSATKIDALQVRQFDWKADGKHQEYGLIAQELDAVCPDAVSKGETEDDIWGVDYSKLVPLMLKEIQSLRARVAELENKQ